LCSRCILLEHGRILSDGPAGNLIEAYRASVIEGARADDSESLHRAYLLATDMMRQGQVPPPDLEEQGLRYALKLAPEDTAMWQRYFNIQVAQGKQVDPQIEVRLILSALALYPARPDLQERLKLLLDTTGEQLPADLRVRAATAVNVSESAPS